MYKILNTYIFLNRDSRSTTTLKTTLSSSRNTPNIKIDGKKSTTRATNRATTTGTMESSTESTTSEIERNDETAIADTRDNSDHWKM